MLKELPDLETNSSVTAWAESRALWINSWHPSLEELATFKPIIAPPYPETSTSFGRWSDPLWRKFVFSILLADWACYPQTTDRADFSRLLFTMDRFPSGFRSWCLQHSGGEWVPVGYTGWFPIDEFTFNRLEMQNPSLQDRALLPMCKIDTNPRIYLFNFSIIPALQRTIYAGRLLHELFRDLVNIQPTGLAAITVSSDGAQLARRLGLHHTSELILDGSREIIFTGSSSELRLSRIASELS